MQFKIVPTKKANSQILAHTIKLKDLVIRKGKVLNKEHLSILIKNRINEIYVAILQKEDYPENISADLIAKHICSKKLFNIIVSNGRADIYSRLKGVLNIDEKKLLRINEKNQDIAICSIKNYSVIKEGQLVGNVKVLPYAISKRNILKITNDKTIKNIFHIAKKTINKVGIIFTSNHIKINKEEKILKAINLRLENFNLKVNHKKICKHNHKILALAIKEILKKNIDLILIYGETSISDINDVVPKSIATIKGRVISSIMPTDPGNLLLIGNISNTTIIGVPGCAKSLKRNGFDDILERVCHGEKFNKKKLQK